MHPLVRWQFQGGLAEDQRRAFLFTNVIDAAGQRYDMPVVVGALAASPHIYSVGMGRPVEEIETAWTQRHRQSDPAGARDRRRRARRWSSRATICAAPGKGLAALPVPISTPGFDAAPYLTATLCGHARSGDRHAEHGHLSRAA